MTTEVWVLTIDAIHNGDYNGYISVHRTRDNALDRLWRHIERLGLLNQLQADWNAVSDDGCTAADIDTGDGTISYGISRHPVE